MGTKKQDTRELITQSTEFRNMWIGLLCYYNREYNVYSSCPLNTHVTSICNARSMLFLCSPKEKHIVAALSVHPVTCPANNFKITISIETRTWFIDRWL